MAIPLPAPDRTAIVTGASSGIGDAIARLLASRGHGVTLVARRLDRLEALAAELSKRHEVRAEVVAADLTEPDQRRAVVEAVEEAGLTPEVLVNNAGFTTVGLHAEIDAEAEISMIRTNVEAVDHLCRLVSPGMLERGRGAILNVASTASYQPMPGQAGYAASKAYVRSFSTALAGELAPRNITVTTLCPGPVRTEFTEAAASTGQGFGGAEDDLVPELMWVSPDEVARLALDGLDLGRLVVIPGAPNRIGALLGHLTPRQLLVPVMALAHPGLRQPGRR